MAPIPPTSSPMFGVYVCHVDFFFCFQKSQKKKVRGVGRGLIWGAFLFFFCKKKKGGSWRAPDVTMDAVVSNLDAQTLYNPCWWLGHSMDNVDLCDRLRLARVMTVTVFAPTAADELRLCTIPKGGPHEACVEMANVRWRCQGASLLTHSGGGQAWYTYAIIWRVLAPFASTTTGQ